MRLSPLSTGAAGTWHTLVVSLGFDKHFVVGVDGKTGRFVGQMPALADLTTIAPNVNELLNRSPQAAALLIGTLMQQVHSLLCALALRSSLTPVVTPNIT